MNRKTLFYSCILFAGFIMLYSPVFPDLFHMWFKYNNNSHGILVPCISLFLVWRQRGKIHWDEIQQSNTGLAVIIISLFLYIVGYAGGIEVLPRLTIVTTLIGLVLYNWGYKIFTKMAFPLLFLFFMVPVPVSIVNQVTLPLQLWVTDVSMFIISSLSITVLQEGNILHFANASLEVAEACSGIRSLTAYIMLGFLFAYLMHGTYLRRSLMIFLAIPLSFFVNILRVTGTGILAHFYGSRVARGFLHEFSGLTVFAVGFILLFIIFTVLDKRGLSGQENLSETG